MRTHPSSQTFYQRNDAQPSFRTPCVAYPGARAAYRAPHDSKNSYFAAVASASPVIGQSEGFAKEPPDHSIMAAAGRIAGHYSRKVSGRVAWHTVGTLRHENQP